MSVDFPLSIIHVILSFLPASGLAACNRLNIHWHSDVEADRRGSALKDHAKMGELQTTIDQYTADSNTQKQVQEEVKRKDNMETWEVESESVYDALQRLDRLLSLHHPAIKAQCTAHLPTTLVRLMQSEAMSASPHSHNMQLVAARCLASFCDCADSLASYALISPLLSCLQSASESAAATTAHCQGQNQPTNELQVWIMHTLLTTHFLKHSPDDFHYPRYQLNVARALLPWVTSGHLASVPINAQMLKRSTPTSTTGTVIPEAACSSAIESSKLTFGGGFGFGFGFGQSGNSSSSPSHFFSSSSSCSDLQQLTMHGLVATGVLLCAPSHQLPPHASSFTSSALADIASAAVSLNHPMSEDALRCLMVMGPIKHLDPTVVAPCLAMLRKEYQDFEKEGCDQDPEVHHRLVKCFSPHRLYRVIACLMANSNNVTLTKEAVSMALTLPFDWIFFAAACKSLLHLCTNPSDDDDSVCLLAVRLVHRCCRGLNPYQVNLHLDGVWRTLPPALVAALRLNHEDTVMETINTIDCLLTVCDSLNGGASDGDPMAPYFDREGGVEALKRLKSDSRWFSVQRRASDLLSTLLSYDRRRRWHRNRDFGNWADFYHSDDEHQPDQE